MSCFDGSKLGVELGLGLGLGVELGLGFDTIRIADRITLRVMNRVHAISCFDGSLSPSLFKRPANSALGQG